MNALPSQVPTLRPARPPRPRLHVGDAWFVILPGHTACACVFVDELTPRTVVLRREPDVGAGMDVITARFARADVRFVDRVPPIEKAISARVIAEALRDVLEEYETLLDANGWAKAKVSELLEVQRARAVLSNVEGRP